MKTTEEIKASCTAAFLGLRGALLSFASGVLISGATFLVKYMSNIHPGQHAACRCWFVGSLALPHLIFRKENIFGPPSQRCSVFITAFLNATMMISHFFTFKFLPLGEAAVLVSSYPAFVTLAGRIFLKETLDIIQVTAVLLTVIGMILTTGLHNTIADTSRTYSAENLYGLATALAVILSLTVGSILLRKMRSIHFSVMMFSTGIIGVIESLILTSFVGNFSLPSGGSQRSLIILLGLLSYSALACWICSIKFGEVGPISTIRASSEIFCSFLWQVAAFGNIPDGMTILGSVLVCITIITIGFNHKIKKFLPEKWIKQY